MRKKKFYFFGILGVVGILLVVTASLVAAGVLQPVTMNPGETVAVSCPTGNLLITKSDNNTASLSCEGGIVGTGTGLKGDYFAGTGLTNFKFSRIDPVIGFNWGAGSPDPTLSADNFSVRWTGQLQPRYSETYNLYTTSDDGVRLWVNGVKVIDNWTDHAMVDNSGTISLTAGQKYDLKLEYYERSGSATLKLSWSSKSQALELIPQSQLYTPLATTPTAGTTAATTAPTTTATTPVATTQTTAPVTTTKAPTPAPTTTAPVTTTKAPTTVATTTAAPTTPAPTPAQGGIWKPTAANPIPWQWMIGHKLDLNNSQDMGTNAKDYLGNPVPDPVVYDIDGFFNGYDPNHNVLDSNGKDPWNVPDDTITRLHAMGKKVICYIDVGVYENYRPDAWKFQAHPEIIGSSDAGWNGSYWLDIRRTDILLPIMKSRMQMCKDKGFDAIEPDEIDDYENDTKFGLTYQDQLNYDRLIAQTAHDMGISIGLKGNTAQVKDLHQSFDWTLNEECFQYNECNLLQPFIADNKAVFQVEYKTAASSFCPVANTKGFNAMRMPLQLDGGRVPCR